MAKFVEERKGELLKQWCEDGQWKKLSRCSNEVRVDGVALILFYMPVRGSEAVAIEGAKEELMVAMEWVGSEENGGRRQCECPCGVRQSDAWSVWLIWLADIQCSEAGVH